MNDAVERTPEETDALWARAVRSVLRVEMARRLSTYSVLAKELAEIGVEIDERVLRNKVARGTFSAIFFFQCLVAMKSTGISINGFDFPRKGEPMMYIRGETPDDL